MARRTRRHRRHVRTSRKGKVFPAHCRTEFKSCLVSGLEQQPGSFRNTGRTCMRELNRCRKRSRRRAA